jgi:hypothetical protein
VDSHSASPLLPASLKFLYRLDTPRPGLDPILMEGQIRCEQLAIRVCKRVHAHGSARTSMSCSKDNAYETALTVNRLDGVTIDGEASNTLNPHTHHSISVSHLVGGPNSPGFGSVDDQRN